MRSLRVFLCSPGDVAEERELARRIIERFQLRYKDRLELILTAWEDLPMSETRTFQDQIPRSIDYDVVVAILWNRLGSPLPDHYKRPDGRAYESGTVYELELALGGRPDGQRPS